MQRYDFGGPYRPRTYSHNPSRKTRRTLIVRGLAVVCALSALIAFKRLSGNTPSGAGLGAPGEGKSAVASFGLGSASYSESIPARTPRIPSGPTLDWQTPMVNYPRPDTFSVRGDAMVADYAPDSLLNARVNVYLHRYRPETGVIMIADLQSGHVLAIGEREDSVVSEAPKLAYGGGGFPAASLIKILTATAALESNAPELTDSIPQIGGYHTLYKRQLKTDGLRNYPKITLEEAFSKSVNPAFAILGLSMGPKVLRNTAIRMGFNKGILPACVARSHIEFPDSGFPLAETACGFTAKTTISPWHALQIARGAGDDGRMRPCAFARSIVNLRTGTERPVASDTGMYFISPANLPVLQELMQATVKSGTARKGFHSILRASHLQKIEAGGKTGSLDGEETPGRFDWFIGYVKLKEDPSRGLAFSIMLVHREYSNIHASQMAALLIRDWLAACEKAARARKADLAYRAA